MGLDGKRHQDTYVPHVVSALFLELGEEATEMILDG